MDIQIIDEWAKQNYIDGGYDRFATLHLGNHDFCDVKRKSNGYTYVMVCGNGYEVYKGNYEGVRHLEPDEESKILRVYAEKSLIKGI